MSNYTNNFFKTNIILLKIAGMWLPLESDSTFRKTLYYIYNSIIFIYTEILFFLSELFIINVTISDLNLLITHLGMLSTHLMGNVKVYIFLTKFRQIHKLLDLLSDGNEYVYETYKDFQPKEIFNQAKKLTKILSLTFWCLSSNIGCIAAVTSLYVVGTVEVFPKEDKACLDYTSFLFRSPIPNNNNRILCMLSLFFEDIGLLIYAFQIVAFDTLFAGLLNCIKVHILTLSGAFRTIRQRCLQRMNRLGNVQDFYDCPELENELNKEMKKCTRHLQLILEICEQVEDIFAFVTLGQTLVSLFVYASCLFRTATMPIFSSAFLPMLQYFSAVAMQFALYCWFGNEVTLAGHSIRDAIYETDWFSSSRRFKQYMLINICRMQHPIYVSIGKFSPLTLGTLVSIWRASFSYFAVFNKVQQN